MHVLNLWAHLLLRRAAAATRLPIMPSDVSTRGFHRYGMVAVTLSCYISIRMLTFNLALSHAHGAAHSFFPAPCP